MKIIEINDFTDFIRLKPDWGNLLLESEHSVFSTWTWLSTWWKHFGKNRELLLLLAEENQKLVAIAPLMVTTEPFSQLHRKKIEIIGTPDADYNSFILARTSEKEKVLYAFFKYLDSASKKWDILRFTDIPDYAGYLLLMKIPLK